MMWRKKWYMGKNLEGTLVDSLIIGWHASAASWHLAACSSPIVVVVLVLPTWWSVSLPSSFPPHVAGPASPVLCMAPPASACWSSTTERQRQTQDTSKASLSYLPCSAVCLSVWTESAKQAQAKHGQCCQLSWLGGLVHGVGTWGALVRSVQSLNSKKNELGRKKVQSERKPSPCRAACKAIIVAHTLQWSHSRPIAFLLPAGLIPSVGWRDCVRVGELRMDPLLNRCL
jgi:hypothetical protein